MASQVRGKQQRPLSIINEGSLDDYAENYFQNESSDDAKELSDLETRGQHRQARRKAVAPLEHPVVALSQGQLPVKETSFHENSTNCCTDVTAKERKHYEDVDRQTDVSERCSHSGYSVSSVYKHSSDSVNSVQNDESLQSRIFSENDTRSKHIEGTCDVSSTHLSDHYSVSVNENTNNHKENKYTTLCDQQIIAESDGRKCRDIQNDTCKSEGESNHYNSSERCSNEQRKFPSQKCLKDNERWRSKFSEVNIVSKTLEITNISNAEHQKADEKETLSKEQQAWRNRVRKSSSFTLSSAKTRPLRRSMGSYDFKKSSFPVCSERSFKNGDSAMKINSYNNNVKFYLSSDACEDQKDMININHESGHNCDELENPKESSFHRNNSWHASHTKSFSLTAEPSSSVQTQSSFGQSKFLHSLPNLGTLITNQQPGVSHSKSDESFSNSLNYKTSKRTYPDIQSNNLLVRRISTVDQSDLRTLESLATRLKLPTRRLSTTIWREKYLDGNSILSHLNLPQNSRIRSESVKNDKNTKPFNYDCLNSEDNERLHNLLGLVREDLVSFKSLIK